MRIERNGKLIVRQLDCGLVHRYKIIRADGRVEKHIIRVPASELCMENEYKITDLHPGDVIFPFEEVK